MLVLIADAGPAAAENEAAVRHAAVIALEFLLADEMDRRVIIGKIVGHFNDLLLNSRCICAVFKNDKAFSCVLLPCCQLRGLTAADGLEGCVNRDRVLFGVFDAGDAADRIGVSLGDTLAPEGVILSVGEDRVCISARQGEQARIPSAGDQGDMAGRRSSGVDIGEMLGNARVSIKAVDDVEQGSVLRCLYRKIRCTAAADDGDIDLVLPRLQISGAHDRDSLCQDLNGSGISAREYSGKLHVLCLSESDLDAFSQIAISDNTDSDAHRVSSLMKILP